MKTCFFHIRTWLFDIKTWLFYIKTWQSNINFRFPQVNDLKSIYGFNLAALRHMQYQQDEDEKVRALLEATTKYKDKKRRKKQKQRAIQTAIISLWK